MKRTTSTPVALPSTRSAKITSTPAAVLPPDEVDELSPDAPVAIDESELPQLRRVSIPILPLNKPEERPPPSPDRRPPREERGRSRTRKSIVSVSYSLSRSRLDALQEENEEEEAEATTGAQQDSSETDPITSFTNATPSTRQGSSRRRTGSPAGRRRLTTGSFDGGTSAFFKNQAAQSTRREVFEEPASDAVDDLNTPDEEPQSEDELTPEPMRVSKKRQSDVEVLPDASVESEDEDELSPQQDATLDDTIASARTPLADRGTNTIRSRPPPSKRPREDIESDPPAQKKQKTSATQTQTRRKYGGPTIPITIYRRNKLAEDDPLGIDPDPIPSMQPSDVLSQISTEVINAYISNVPDAVRRSTGGDNSQSSRQAAKKSLRYQMQALQQFRDNLADSLRGITFAQHSLFKFGGEVRKKRRQKRELREELMQRRREREEIEREIDRVRGEHLRREREQERRRQLVDDVESIERAVRRGREEAGKDVAPGSSVVADVGDVTARLGVLERVKAFNAFLAKTAETL